MATQSGQSDVGGTVSIITSSDGSLTITGASGPEVIVDQTWGINLVAPPAVRTTSLVTSTLPGAFPYAGSQTYLSTGPLSLDAGNYIAFVTIVATVTASNTEYWFDVFANGQPSETLGIGLKPTSQPLGKANSSAFLSAQVVLSWPGGSLTSDLQVAKAAGSGSVEYSFANISIAKVPT